MKQTIAELGIGGEGWIIYGDHVLPKISKRVAHVKVVSDWHQDDKLKTLMPEYLVREKNVNSDGVRITRDLILFANEIVYSTREEAEAELQKQVNNIITSIEQKDDWKKLLGELDNIQKQFENITEDQKKDVCTFIKKLKNIADPQSDTINWNQVRIDAAISVLNALLETTKHSVLEELAVKDIFAKTAVGYADKLIYELKRSEALFEEKLKEL